MQVCMLPSASMIEIMSDGRLANAHASLHVFSSAIYS